MQRDPLPESHTYKGKEMVNEKSNMKRGNAAVLAIGTAAPPYYINQSEYADYYFRVTKSDHVSELKEKLTRICDGTKIRKRHFYMTEKVLKDHPSLATYKENSLNDRNTVLAEVIPELAKKAAEKALTEWGQPRSKITHLVFHTTTGCIDLHGPDFQLANQLGLSPTTNRFMLYYNGCYGGGTVLRLAKDIAENNPGSRVLVVCSETTVSFFRGPSETSMDTLVSQAIFGDGAGAVILAADPDLSIERPLFEIVAARQCFIPNTVDAIGGRVSEAGLAFYISQLVPAHLSNNIEKCLTEAFSPLGIHDWNSLFWIVHTGGKKIIDGIEEELNLDKEKMNVTRHVLAEYGNMASSSVMFVMDEMRKRSVEEKKATTGEGAEFGVLLGFGPGVTVETVVLRAFRSPN